MPTTRATILTALLALCCACADSKTIITPVEAAAINQRAGAQTWYLGSSMYYADFFLDDTLYWVTPYDPARSRMVKFRHGYIRPEKTFGVVPMGAALRVKRVDFPDRDAMASRPVTSPRWFPWVTLEFLDGPLAQSPRPFVLVVELGEQDGPAQFDKALAGYLLTSDPKPWLDALPAGRRQAILEKRAVYGMSEREMEAALGAARSVIGFASGDIDEQLWIYPDRAAFHFVAHLLQNEAPLRDDELVKLTAHIEQSQREMNAQPERPATSTMAPPAAPPGP